MDLDFVQAVVTGYSSTPDQTDETPWLTAWSTQTRPGVIALSRDLLRTFTDGAPFDYGDRILVAGVGVFLVEDTMADRWTSRADIWFPTRQQAQQWGRRETLLARVQEEARVDVVAEDQLAAILDEPQP
jgi:3D (Asp-Asp-Asp) domain-containing protein